MAGALSRHLFPLSPDMQCDSRPYSVPGDITSLVAFRINSRAHYALHIPAPTTKFSCELCTLQDLLFIVSSCYLTLEAF